jgi:uncharacterized membrane protein
MQGGNFMGKGRVEAQSKGSIKKQVKKNNNYGKFIILGGVLIIAIMGTFIFRDKSGNSSTVQAAIKINKEEVSSTAKFYPYESDGIKMEVLAVKASDGTIRTALNTCQVCYPSGRGYYIQEGDELVCQNCGNRFKLDMIEVVKNGCNPVPVLEENKSDDGTSIIIDKNFLDENRGLFKNWKS